MKRVVSLVLWIVLAPLPAVAQSPDLPEAARVDMRWGVKIPLRDGIRLSATAYLPKSLQQPAPCLLTLTPYVAQAEHHRGLYFAARGLPFVIVDSRGRGNSEGEFRPSIQEARDGYDVVEWLARQPYCNGRIGMWGGSYAGYDQWAVAKEQPPHLATIAPAAAIHQAREAYLHNNIMSTHRLRWLMFTSGRTSQERIVSDMQFWATKYRELFESGRPFKEFDQLIGNPSPTFQEWIAHPYPDAYWTAYTPTAEQYSRIDLPILSITGSYDDSQPGALTYYREHMRHASPEARARHYLVIGPWDHAGTRTPKAEFGGVEVGPASLIDLPQLHLDWYAWTMQGGPRPSFLQEPVAYYVMEAEKWRYAATLDAVTAEHVPYFLSSTGDATDVFNAGSLGRSAPQKSRPDRYVYDPRDTSGAALESALEVPPKFTDQRMVLASGGRQVVYHTEPFARAAEISGFFRLSVWIAIDQPDTDFRASVYEIDVDGASLLLSSDIMRARYREGMSQPKLIPPNKVLRYDFERFSFISRRIGAGSRLRLVIDPINSILWQKNYNSGGVVAEESMKDARTVEVTIFHDRAQPSSLWVPFGHPDPT